MEHEKSIHISMCIKDVLDVMVIVSLIAAGLEYLLDETSLRNPCNERRSQRLFSLVAKPVCCSDEATENPRRRKASVSVMRSSKSGSSSSNNDFGRGAVREPQWRLQVMDGRL
jgi:hypothetical protein